MKPPGPTGRLTPRQSEVLELVSKGLTNREIGPLLGISARTVKYHVEMMLYNFQVTNRTELVASTVARGVWL